MKWVILMDSCTVFGVLREIEEASGNDKLRLLKENESDTLKQALKAAYCPFTTYGVKKLPEVDLNPTKNGFDQKTWALLDALASRRLTGGAAQDAIAKELLALPASSGLLLKHILTKDLRAGISISSINKVFPGLIFKFECMLAHPFDEKRIAQWPVAVEPKYDGVRALFIYTQSQGGFYSRTGKRFESLDDMAHKITQRFQKYSAPAIVLDGEIMDRSNSFHKIVGDVHKKGIQLDQATFNIFDVIPYGHFSNGEYVVPYKQRNVYVGRILTQWFPDLLGEELRKVPSRLCSTHGEIMDYYQEIRDQGGEGVIVKPMDHAYVCKRSHSWLKIKDCQSVDAPVVDFVEGTGKFENNLGALVIDVDGVRVNVGSGLDDATRRQIWSDRDRLKGLMVEVEYHEKTPDGSLRHPRFVRFRTDKQ